MKHFGGLVVIQSVSWVWRTTRELNWKQYPKLVKVRWMFYSLMTIFVSPSPCPRVNHKSRFTRTQRIFFFSLISPPKGVVDSGETCFSCAPGFSYWFFLWLWAVSSQFSHQCNYWEAPHLTHSQQHETLPKTFKNIEKSPSPPHTRLNSRTTHSFTWWYSEQRKLQTPK